MSSSRSRKRKQQAAAESSRSSKEDANGVQSDSSDGDEDASEPESKRQKYISFDEESGPEASETSEVSEDDGATKPDKQRRKLDRAGRSKAVYAEGSDDDVDPFAADSPSHGTDSDEEDPNESHCRVCGSDEHMNKLLCCDNCPAVYHLWCLKPPMQKAPRGDWYCPSCEVVVKLARDISHIVDYREPQGASKPVAVSRRKSRKQRQPRAAAGGGGAAAGDGGAELGSKGARGGGEYLIKRKGHSWRRIEWVKAADMQAAAASNPALKTRLKRFHVLLKEWRSAGEPVGESGTTVLGAANVDPEWSVAERVIAWDKRDKEYLVKWQGLDYSHSTWEDELDQPGDAAAIEAFHSRGPIAAAGAAEPPHTGKAPKYDKMPAWLHGGSLHDYQVVGMNWLLHNWHLRTGVILGDEMGLGKTIQCIAFLSSLFKLKVPVRKPHLLVVPLSTLPNWIREFETWAPQLNVVALHGPKEARQVILENEIYDQKELEKNKGSKAGQKARKQAAVKMHVLVTTYEGVGLETAALKRLEWECLVVDEGHRVRGQTSKLTGMLGEIAVSHRVLLTGTPLQNSVEELFALLKFIDPDQFADVNAFVERFSDITTEEQVSELHNLLKPHLLKRFKKDVLKKLPPKMEQVVPVELTAHQKRHYRSVLINRLPDLAGGSSRSVTMLQNILMQLRKVCNHAYLLEADYPEYDSPEESLKHLLEASGKLQLLDRMLPQLRRQGHRVLVYSQFVMVLDLLEDWLQLREWGYQRLDGSVPAAVRQKRIDAFNSKREENFVFLLSTRAGGMGINLATADTVIIHDVDWNPQMDLQAQARAHRMGQTQPVMTYYLVTRATVEERMLQRAKQKMALEHMVVGSLDKGKMKASDIDDILKYGAEELFDEAGDEQEEESGDEDGQAEDGLVTKTGDQAGVDKGEKAGEESGGKKAEKEGGDRKGEGENAEEEGRSDKAGVGQQQGDAAEGTATRAEQKPGKDGDAEGESGRGKATSRKKKSKKDKVIVYDDDAVAKLLDRSRLDRSAETDEEEAAQDDTLMSRFKTAFFNMKDMPEDQPTEQESSQPPPAASAQDSRQYWQQLLKGHYQHQADAEMAEMGAGKRTRKRVDYSEDVFDRMLEEGTGSGSLLRPNKRESSGAGDAAGKGEGDGSRKQGGDEDVDGDFEEELQGGGLQESEDEEEELLQQGAIEEAPRRPPPVLPPDTRNAQLAGKVAVNPPGRRKPDADTAATDTAQQPGAAANLKAATPQWVEKQDGQLFVMGLGPADRLVFAACVTRYGLYAAMGQATLSFDLAPFKAALPHLSTQVLNTYLWGFRNALVSAQLSGLSAPCLKVGVPASTFLCDRPVLFSIGTMTVLRDILQLCGNGKAVPELLEVMEAEGRRARKTRQVFWGARHDLAFMRALVKHGWGAWKSVLTDARDGAFMLSAMLAELNIVLPSNGRVPETTGPPSTHPRSVARAAAGGAEPKAAAAEPRPADQQPASASEQRREDAAGTSSSGPATDSAQQAGRLEASSSSAAAGKAAGEGSRPGQAGGSSIGTTDAAAGLAGAGAAAAGPAPANAAGAESAAASTATAPAAGGPGDTGPAQGAAAPPPQPSPCAGGAGAAAAAAATAPRDTQEPRGSAQSSGTVLLEELTKEEMDACVKWLLQRIKLLLQLIVRELQHSLPHPPRPAQPPVVAVHTQQPSLQAVVASTSATPQIIHARLPSIQQHYNMPAAPRQAPPPPHAAAVLRATAPRAVAGGVRAVPATLGWVPPNAALKARDPAGRPMPLPVVGDMAPMMRNTAPFPAAMLAGRGMINAATAVVTGQRWTQPASGAPAAAPGQVILQGRGHTNSRPAARVVAAAAPPAAPKLEAAQQLRGPAAADRPHGQGTAVPQANGLSRPAGSNATTARPSAAPAAAAAASAAPGGQAIAVHAASPSAAAQSPGPTPAGYSAGAPDGGRIAEAATGASPAAPELRTGQASSGPAPDAPAAGSGLAETAAFAADGATGPSLGRASSGGSEDMAEDEEDGDPDAVIIID